MLTLAIAEGNVIHRTVNCEKFLKHCLSGPEFPVLWSGKKLRLFLLKYFPRAPALHSPVSVTWPYWCLVCSFEKLLYFPNWPRRMCRPLLAVPHVACLPGSLFIVYDKTILFYFWLISFNFFVENCSPITLILTLITRNFHFF